MPTDEIGTERFDSDPAASERRIRARPLLPSPRRCVTYDYSVAARTDPELTAATDGALGFLPRDELVAYVHEQAGQPLCGAGTTCPGAPWLVPVVRERPPESDVVRQLGEGPDRTGWSGMHATGCSSQTPTGELRRRRRRLADFLPVRSSAIVAAGPTLGPCLPTRRPIRPPIRVRMGAASADAETAPRTAAAYRTYGSH